MRLFKLIPVLFLFIFTLLPQIGEAAELKIISSVPEGQVNNLNQITVRFSENMRPLGKPKQSVADSPLILTVKDGTLPPGEFRWLDPMTLAYFFKKPINEPLIITASVKAGTKAISGATLANEHSWKISSPPLNVSCYTQTLNPDAEIIFNTNYQLNLKSLQETTRVLLKKNKNDPGSNLPVTINYVKGSSSANNHQYRISINSKLPPDSVVELVLSAKLKLEKGTSYFAGKSITFATYSSPKFIDWNIYGQEKNRPVYPESPLYLTFNNMINTEDLLEHIQITPKVELVYIGDSYGYRPFDINLPKEEQDKEKKEYMKQQLKRNSSSFMLHYAFKPKTKYSVTIKKDLKDCYGLYTKTDTKFSFATGNFRPYSYFPTGDFILEKKLGGSLPLITLNAKQVKFKPQITPWFSKKSIESNPVTHKLEPQNIYIGENISMAEIFGKPLDELQGSISLETTVTLEDLQQKTGTYDNQYRTTLTVTDLGISTKIGPEGGLVWVTSISEAKPIAGVNLQFFDSNGTKLAEGKSDKHGIMLLPKGSPALGATTLLARHNQDSIARNLHYYRFNSGLNDYLANVDTQLRWTAHMLTQLPLYQPGQEVNFTLFVKAVARAFDGNEHQYPVWKPLADEKIKVTVLDSRNKEVHSFEALSNAYGALTGSFTLSDEAALGNYYIQVTIKRTGNSNNFNSGFKVAAIRPPDFKVDLEIPQNIFAPVPDKAADGGTELKVKGMYFTGSPLAGGKTELQEGARNSYFTPKPLYGYQVGNQRLSPWLRYERIYYPYDNIIEHYQSSSVANLDKNGEATFTLGTFNSKPGLTLDINMMATVTDVSGLTSQGTGQTKLHPAKVYVGLKTPYYSQAGTKENISIKVSGYDGSMLKNQAVTLKIYHNDANKPSGMRTNYNGIFTLVHSENLILGHDVFQLKHTFKEQGSYKIEATVKDQDGRINQTTTHIYVFGSEINVYPANFNSQLILELDKKIYAVGDKAKLTIINPLNSGTLLLTTERYGVYSFEIHKLTKTMTTLEIPIKAADAPNIVVSAFLIQGRTAPPPDVLKKGGLDTGAPKFIFANKNIIINPKDKGIRATIETDAKTYAPGGKVKAKVAVKNAAGNPTQAQVTLLAVDARVLRAAGDLDAYNADASFHNLFSASVFSQDIRRFLFIPNIPDLKSKNELKNQRFFKNSPAAYAEKSTHMETMLDGPRGNDEGENLRADFRPYAYWLGMEETDTKGQLEKSFTLPDSLTEYRIVAIVADKKDSFALADTRIKAIKPLQLLSAVPRFTTQGDEFEARFIVQNLSDKKSTIELQAKVSGFTMQGPEKQQLELEAGTSAKVSFKLFATTVGEGSIALSAKMGKEQDGLLIKLPIISPQSLTVVATAGLLKPGESYTLPLVTPKNLDPRSKLDINFAPSPASGLKFSVQSLVDYPWHCLEQRFSRSWVRALRLQHADLLGLEPDPEDKKKILDTFSKIPEFQKNDGGFSLWQSTSSNFYVTTYVLMVNKELEHMDYSLDKKVLQKAEQYLATEISSAIKNRHFHEDTLSLGFWTLSRYNPKLAGELYQQMYNSITNSKRANPISYAALMLAANELPKLKGKEEKLNSLRKLMEKTIAITPTQMHFRSNNNGWYWENMGSSLRDNGLILWALAKTEPDYPRLEALAYWVSQELGRSQWLSTQEAMFGSLGLVEYLKHLGGNQTVELKAEWNGKESVTQSFKRLIEPSKSWVLDAKQLNTGKKESELKLKALKGSPYWTVRYRYTTPDEPAEQTTAGFTISREWLTPGPWTIGDVIQIKLTVTVPETRRHVLIYDPFPAGLESLNASRADLDEVMNEGRRRGNWYWEWIEMREQGLLLYASRLNPGTYTYTYSLRAATPGKFIQRQSHAEEMYMPEVMGLTTTDKVEVKPED